MSAASPEWHRSWSSPQDLLVGLALFVIAALLSVLVTGWILVRMPEDYFVGDAPAVFLRGRHPALRTTGRVLKNLLGVALIVVGVVMSVPGVPGQGLLTILIGLMLLDIPGKRRLERRLVQRPRVLAFINGVRRRYRRPPLRFEEGGESGSAPPGAPGADDG
ncbi:MAG: hypothetical protein JNL38_10995 [Myxococcales bacterium]|nr:hypothetical protein [Myxococcales bacterium]